MIPAKVGELVLGLAMVAVALVFVFGDIAGVQDATEAALVTSFALAAFVHLLRAFAT